MKLDRATLLLAKQLSDRYWAEYCEYLDERAAYRRDGYRAHYCEHGTNMWTDYDAICGGCEDGMTMGDPIQRRQRAIEDAKCRVAEARRVLDLAEQARRMGVGDAIDMTKIWARVDALFTVR